MSEPVVFLNGEYMPLSEAKVPVLDRGFIFGDGIYDVVPVYQRKMFRPVQHLARLRRGLTAIGIGEVFSNDQWLEIIQRLVRDYETDDQFIYLQVTRGVAPRAHAFPPDARPTVFAMA